MNDDEIKEIIKEKLERVEKLEDKDGVVYVLVFDDADEEDILRIRDSVDWRSIFRKSGLLFTNTSLKNIEKKTILKKLRGEKDERM